MLNQGAQQLKVVYHGNDPLPDTFKPGAQALADGRLGPTECLQANKIQAKCASKYEVKPPQRLSHESPTGAKMTKALPPDPSNGRSPRI